MEFTASKVSPEPAWIWPGDVVPPRNQFVRFTRTFRLDALPARLLFDLCADTRYRLHVNGVFVATGPGRFVTQAPEYDTHDLAPHLTRGQNLIEVVVNFFGASSYQSMPDGQPGFWARGGAGEVDLATPGDWQAFRLSAWRSDAPLFSFAQNPVEICDLRRMDASTELPVRVRLGGDAPWGNPRPFSGAPIPFARQHPRTIDLAGPLLHDDLRIGFMAHNPIMGQPYSGLRRGGLWTAFATWIHSPRSQHVRAGAFWSELCLNGQPISLEPDPDHGNCGHINLALQAGWNLLTGEVEVLSEYWAYVLSIPRAADLSLHARKERTCANPLALAPVSERDQLRVPGPSDRELPAGWHEHNGDALHLTPARIMAWDRPAPGGIRWLEAVRLDEIGAIHAESAVWSFAFDGEFLGHIVLDIDAPAGSVLDVACDDWQRPDGTVALYQTNPFTDSADRFVLPGGRRQVELFHPRGGKYVQVVLRVPDGTGPAPLILNDLWVRSRQTLPPDGTRFDCDLAALTWAWPVTMNTLRCSTDEAYSDSPWRERGSYIGDTWVNIGLHTLLSSDLRIATRVLRQFGEAQLPDGQLPCCAPAWLRKPHEDFSLLWPIALLDNLRATGDPHLAHAMQPVLRRLWASPSWNTHTSGLWNARETRLFIDWGCTPGDREGDGNAVLNILRVAARRACAELATRIGDEHQADVHRLEANTIEQAILRNLWSESEGRLHSSLTVQTTAIHANILALRFGLGAAALRERIVTYLEPLLRSNRDRGLQNGERSGYLDLYFLNFALPALAEHGRPDLAERLIADHYGLLMYLNDDTLPESFARVVQQRGSRCHSWSGAAALYAARYVLGLREDPRDGQLIFQPVVRGIQRASGRIAHPAGWIDVAWKKENGQFHYKLKAPSGVDVAPRLRDPQALTEEGLSNQTSIDTKLPMPSPVIHGRAAGASDQP